MVLLFNKVVPFTFNVAFGAVVPIPTFPFVCILILSTLSDCVNLIAPYPPKAKSNSPVALYKFLTSPCPITLKPSKYVYPFTNKVHG